MLTNSPAVTMLRLEARRSFTLGVECWTSATSKADITDHVLTFTLRKTKLKGGTLLLTRTLDLFEPEHGRALLALQAADLDLTEDTYLWSLTILTPTGYSGTLAKGELEIVENTDPSTSGTYSGEGLAQSIQLVLQRNNTMRLTVGRLVDFNGSVSGGGGATALDDLTDVATAGATAAQVLGFDGTSWGPVDAAVGGGGSTTLAGLTDVNFAGLTLGDLLYWDGAHWTNWDIPLDKLGDVTITSALTNQVLTYNGTAWVNQALPGGVTLPIAQSDVTGLVTALAGKAPTTHSHAESDITGLVADLSAKLVKASNLSDLANAATARTNLGIATVGNTGAYADLTGKPTLGTAAPLNVPASGNAAAGEVVKGNDTRLTDSRTPTAHQASHAAGGSDPVAIDDSQVSPVTPNTQTGTTYTFVLADKHRVVTASNAAGQAYTIPPNSSVAFPVGTVLQVIQLAAGQVTWTAGAGVTLRTPRGAKTAVQYAMAQAVKIATDEWVIGGDVTT